MNSLCRAITKSKVPCQRKAIPGSKYCIFHLEHQPLLYAAIVGAIIGLFVNEGYRAIVPSKESIEVDSLRKEISLYQNQLQSEQRESQLREQIHLTKLDNLNLRLDPFISLAKVKYPNLDTGKALSLLRKELAEVRELATPPTLYYDKYTSSFSSGRISARIFLRRSKDASLGRLNFVLRVISPSSVKIIEIEPGNNSMNVSTQITPDGTSAQIDYSISVGDDPAIEIALSGKAKLKLTGNNGLQPTLIDIR